MKISYILIKKVIPVFALVLISGFIYFYKLGSIPNGFYVDEATVAFNAKSLLETGRDEYGYKTPIYLRLLGSYTPSFFIYISALAIKFFGYGVSVFRSISAVSMICAVLIFYFLAVNLNIFKSKLSLFVISLFFAISPWIVFNARLGYETTLAFAIFNLGMLFLYLAIKNNKLLTWAVLFLSLSTYISHNQRFLAPLVLAVYLFTFRSTVFKYENYKYLKTAFIVGLISQIPNLLMINTNAFWIKNSQFDIRHLINYLIYLSPKRIFLNTEDIDMQHTLPGISLFYEHLAPFYLIGLFILVKGIKNISNKFIIFYLLISLFPAVFSGPFFSTQRALAFAVPLALVIGLGIEKIFNYLGGKLALVFATPAILFALWRLYGSYFVLFPNERDIAWNYGYDKVAEFISSNPNSNFLVDNTRNPRNYILLLYHLKVDPSYYQKEVGSYYKENYYLASVPATEYSFQNVTVGPIDWEEDIRTFDYIIGDELSVSDSQAEEHGLKIAHTVNGTSGNIMFKIYSTIR